MQSEPLLKVRELSNYLNVSISWIYQQVEKEKIPYIRLSGCIRFKLEDVLKWLEMNDHKN